MIAPPLSKRQVNEWLDWFQKLRAPGAESGEKAGKMPHYKDGTPAEIGDLVVGVPYNTKGQKVVGTLVQITEDAESCNCIVAFVDPVVVNIPAASLYPHLGALAANIIRRKGGRVKAQDSGEQEVVLLNPRYDYGAVADFVKL